MADPIVQIEHLSHHYGDRLALDDLSLTVNAGEVFGFLGPNGSGKTTLFRILCTLLPGPPGSVKILGLDPASDRDGIRRQIGVVFQSPSLDKQLTAAENLQHQGHLYGLRGEELRERIARALAAVGLTDRARERVSGFSGGMRRRVEVAKGLLHRPRVLLMDEPSTGLDPGARIDMWRHLREISSSQGVTVLLTTHLMEEAEHCDRLAVMRAGKLLACDSPAALKSRIGGDVITVRTKDPAAVREVLKRELSVDAEQVGETLRLEQDHGGTFVPRLVEAAPGLIDSVSVGRPTLEDVFIQLTGQQFANDAAH